MYFAALAVAMALAQFDGAPAREKAPRLAKVQRAAGFSQKKRKKSEDLAASPEEQGAARSAALDLKELAFPTPGTSIETLKGDVTAVARVRDQVVAMPRVSGDKLVAITVPYREVTAATGGAESGHAGDEAAVRAARFGKITDQARRVVAKGEPSGAEIEWRAVLGAEGKTLLFDGVGMTFFEADPATLSEVSRRSIPWDQIAPPRDRGGEATSKELTGFRTRFAKATNATLGVRIAGLAKMPAGWAPKGEKGVTYFAATRIPGFLLLTIGCRGEDPSQCAVERACDVAGAKDLRPQDVVGVGAIDGKKGERLVLIGDASRREILSFNFQSCFNVPRTKRQWLLPARVKAFTNFSVDEAEQLWVASGAPDDYLNASVYVWKKGDW